MNKKRDLGETQSLKNLWDNIKHNNICIIGFPEVDECERGIENLFGEIMAESFPNLVKEKGTQLQEGQSPNKDELKATEF